MTAPNSLLSCLYQSVSSCVCGAGAGSTCKGQTGICNLLLTHRLQIIQVSETENFQEYIYFSKSSTAKNFLKLYSCQNHIIKYWTLGRKNVFDI